MDVPACFSYILGFLGEGGMDGRLRGDGERERNSMRDGWFDTKGDGHGMHG